MTSETFTQRAEAWQAVRDAMVVDWPAAERGALRIGPMQVSADDAAFSRMRAAFQGGRGYVPEGTYTGLWLHGQLWMSDTPDERRDHTGFIADVTRRTDRRRILVTGLGLGMVVRGLVAVAHVEQIDVIERDADVVALVGPLITAWAAERGTTVRVHHADAYAGWRLLRDRVAVDWAADAAWHDIWPTIGADNWAEMKRLKRAWQARVDMQSCWLESECRRLAR